VRINRAATVTAVIAAKKLKESSVPISPSPLKFSLRSIGQKIGFFSSNMRKKGEEKEVLDSKKSAAGADPNFL